MFFKKISIVSIVILISILVTACGGSSACWGPSYY